MTNTPAMSALQTVVLSKLEKQLPAAKIPAGTHHFDFVVRITGTATRSADTEKTPTGRGMTLETLALFIQRSGIQRERAIEIMMAVMRDNIEYDDDQKEALLRVSGVAEAKERLKAELSKLPKTPVSGQFKFNSVTMETFEPTEIIMVPANGVAGDTFSPHAEEIPTLDEVIARDGSAERSK